MDKVSKELEKVVDRVNQLLELDEEHSAFAIEKATGISRKQISYLRNGKSTLEKTTFKTIINLDNYAKKVLKK